MSSKSQRVAFANDITIIEFPMMIGDNPSVSSGAPIQIGWVPQSTITRNLDMYEHFREGKRRHDEKLIMKVPERLNILLRAGYSLEDIVAAAMTADSIQKRIIENLKKKQGWTRCGVFGATAKNSVAKTHYQHTSKRTQQFKKDNGIISRSRNRKDKNEWSGTRPKQLTYQEVQEVADTYWYLATGLLYSDFHQRAIYCESGSTEQVQQAQVADTYLRLLASCY
jgi:hypothetical protein